MEACRGDSNLDFKNENNLHKLEFWNFLGPIG